MKKVSNLIGAELDYAVALAEGCVYGLPGTIHAFSPSTKWAQGGPIIEREWFCVDRLMDGRWWACKRTDKGDADLYQAVSTTPLIAAMRCYVASKLGDTVEIPDEIGAPR